MSIYDNMTRSEVKDLLARYKILINNADKLDFLNRADLQSKYNELLKRYHKICGDDLQKWLKQ